jgi:inosine/xanthosine triphosphatase
MKTIVVASRNPVKLQAALSGFNQMFPGEEFQVTSAVVPSNVADQPFTSDETLRGAKNRAANAAAVLPGADFYIGIEGGVEEDQSELAVFAWVVIRSQNITGKGRTATFFLPPELAQLVRAGKELGEADDIVFNRSNSKQENGAIGILTGDAVDRARLYDMAVIMALIPFKNPQLYQEKLS